MKSGLDDVWKLALVGGAFWLHPVVLAATPDSGQSHRRSLYKGMHESL